MIRKLLFLLLFLPLLARSQQTTLPTGATLKAAPSWYLGLDGRAIPYFSGKYYPLMTIQGMAGYQPRIIGTKPSPTGTSYLASDSLAQIVSNLDSASKYAYALARKPRGGYINFFGKLVYVFGDSVGAGAGATTSAFYWVNIAFPGLGATVVNNSTSGSTLEKRTPVNPFTGVNMIDKISLIPTKTASIAQIIYALGVNDFGVNSANYTVENYITDYHTVIDSTLKRSFTPTDITIMSPYYVTQTGFNYYSTISGNPAPNRARLLQFVAAAKKVAADYGLNYIDIYNDQLRNDTTQYIADGLHPNNTGHAFIANSVMNFYGSQLTFGSKTQSSVVAPLQLNLGGTVGNSTAGSDANLKALLFDNGSAKAGIGESTNSQDYNIYSGGTHSFWAGGASVATINTLGIISSSASPNYNGSSFTNTNATASAANLLANDAGSAFRFIAWGTTKPGSEMGATRAGKAMINWSGTTDFDIGSINAGAVNLFTNSLPRLTISSAGAIAATVSIKSPIVAATGVLQGTAGTDSLLTKDATTNLVKKIAANYYQAALSGTGIVKSTAGTISYLTDPLPVVNGGTGQNTYATGDFPYASAPNTLSKRTIGSTNNVLTVIGGVPTWAAPATNGTVTSITPAYGLTPQTAITSTGTFAVDTTLITTKSLLNQYAKLNQSTVFTNDLRVSGTNFWITNYTNNGSVLYVDAAGKVQQSTQLKVELNNSVTIGGTFTDPAALLNINTSSRGVKMPTLTLAQRNALTLNSGGSSAGLIIYQTDNTPGYYYFDGTNWNMIAIAPVNVISSASTLSLTNPGAYTFTGTTTTWTLPLLASSAQSSFLIINKGTGNIAFATRSGEFFSENGNLYSTIFVPPGGTLSAYNNTLNFVVTEDGVPVSRSSVVMAASGTLSLNADYLNPTATQYTLTLPATTGFATDGSKISTVLATGTGGVKISVPSGYAIQSGSSFATTTGTGGVTLTQGQKVQIIPIGTNSYYLQPLNGSVTLY